MTDQELVVCIQDGDTQAFRVLYDRYFDYAIRTATIIMHHNESYAADVVQETFIRVYQNIHLYHVDRPFKPWFYRILINECNRLLKKNGKVVSVGDFVLQHEESALPETHYFVEYEELYNAIQKLEPHNRVPIILKYLNGFKEKEIADMLEVNINTIKSRLFKGRQKLKGFLQIEREGNNG